MRLVLAAAVCRATRSKLPQERLRCSKLVANLDANPVQNVHPSHCRRINTQLATSAGGDRDRPRRWPVLRGIIAAVTLLIHYTSCLHMLAPRSVQPLSRRLYTLLTPDTDPHFLSNPTPYFAALRPASKRSCSDILRPVWRLSSNDRQRQAIASPGSRDCM